MSLYFRRYDYWPSLKRVLVIFSWVIVSSALGLFFGIATVFLPPIGAFGLVGIAAIVLLWVLPADSRLSPSTSLVQRWLNLALILTISLPTYYAIVGPGIPFISARRFGIYGVNILTFLIIATSPEAQQSIVDIMRKSKLLSILMFGYPVVAFVSVFFSLSPSESLARLTNMLIEWYSPAIAALLAFRNVRDLKRFVLIVSLCSLVVTFCAVLEFRLQHNVYLALLPKSMVAALAARDPATEAFVEDSAFRNGLYRASSTYTVALSLAEFEAMVFPFALYYLFHGEKLYSRAFGGILLIGATAGIFVSGSRGGYLSAFAGTVVYLTLYMIRLTRTGNRSMAPALFGLTAGLSVLTIAGAITMVGRVRNVVLGGGGNANASNEGREMQWLLGMPKFVKSPLIGHGLGMGGIVVGYHGPGSKFFTIDSTLLQTLMETGVLGTICYFGMLFCAIYITGKQAGFRNHESSDVSLAFCASISSYLFYRFWLSQTDNQLFLFVMMAAVLAVYSQFSDKENTGNPIGNSRLRAA